MADRFIIRVEVLVVDDNGVVDPNPLHGRTTEFALADLVETVLICEEMRDLANDAMNEVDNQSRVTPFVQQRPSQADLRSDGGNNVRELEQ